MSSTLKHPESPSEWAKFVHDEMFPARVGVFEWSGVTVVFDNNPQPLMPDAQKDRLALVVRALRVQGLEPEVGWSEAEHDGKPYTWAVVVRGSHAIVLNRSLWSAAGMRSFFPEESIKVIERALKGLAPDNAMRRPRAEGSKVFEAACKRLLRDCERDGTIYCEPSESESHFDGSVVDLRNVNGTIAMYRVYRWKDGAPRLCRVNDTN